MKTVSYKLTSTSPILMNNIESMFKAKEKPLRMKHDEWEQGDEMLKARMYLDGDKLIIPQHVCKGLLKEGSKASGLKQPGKRKGYTDLVQSTLIIQNPIILDKKIKNVIRHQAFVGMNGTKKVLRIWPKLEEWTGQLDILIADESQFDPKALTEILKFSGLFVGFGDYRPEFGRFNIEEIKKT